MVKCTCLFCWAPRARQGEDKVYEIRDLLEGGATITDAAKTAGVNYALAAKVRAKLGIPQTNFVSNSVSKFAPDDRGLADRMLADGCSYAEVARSLGASRSTIAYWFPGRGFTKKQHAERSRINLLEMRADGRLPTRGRNAA